MPNWTGPHPLNQGRASNRATRACESCRSRKRKCSEGRPTCSFCEHNGFRCNYRENVSTPDVEQLGVLTERIAELEAELANARSKIVNSPGIPTPAYQNADFVPLERWLQKAPSAPTSPIFPTPEGTPLSRLSYVESARARSSGATFQKADHQSLMIEENRPVLPHVDPDSHVQLSGNDGILTQVHHFLRSIYHLYPMICDKTMYETAISIIKEGQRDDLGSAMVWMVVALGIAFPVQAEIRDGVTEFQRSEKIRQSISPQFTLRYVQLEILSALFFLRKGRLVDFWHRLHGGCTNLYTMLCRDHEYGANRPEDEANTVLRLFWVCVNLERDISNAVPLLPVSYLSQLEHSMPLPLGCEEDEMINVPLDTRRLYIFFLAETSLRETLQRIRDTSDVGFVVQDGAFVSRPVTQELASQLDRWELGLPAFLDFDVSPGRGTTWKVATRLKLLYWFAQLSLKRSLIHEMMAMPDLRLQFEAWSMIRAAVDAGYTMVAIALEEHTELDILIASQICEALSLLKEASLYGLISRSKDEDHTLLTKCIQKIYNQLAEKSIWLRYRLDHL